MKLSMQIIYKIIKLFNGSNKKNIVLQTHYKVKYIKKYDTE